MLWPFMTNGMHEPIGLIVACKFHRGFNILDTGSDNQSYPSGMDVVS